MDKITLPNVPNDIQGGVCRYAGGGLESLLNLRQLLMADYITVLELDRPGSSRDNDEPGSFNLRALVYW